MAEFFDTQPTSHWFSFESSVNLLPIIENRFLTKTMRARLITKQKFRIQEQRKQWERHIRYTLMPEMQKNLKAFHERTKIIRICSKNFRIVFEKEEEGTRYMMTWLIQHWWRTYARKNTTVCLIRNYYVNGVTLQLNLDYDTLIEKCKEREVLVSTRMCLLRIVTLCARIFGHHDCECFYKYLHFRMLDCKKFLFGFLVYFSAVNGSSILNDSSQELRQSAICMVKNFDKICIELLKQPARSFKAVLHPAFNIPAERYYPNAFIHITTNFFRHFDQWVVVDLNAKHQNLTKTLHELANLQVRNSQRFANSLLDNVQRQMTVLHSHMDSLCKMHAKESCIVECDLQTMLVEKKVDLQTIHLLLLKPDFRYTECNIWDYHPPRHLADFNNDEFWITLSCNLKATSVEFGNLSRFLDAVQSELFEKKLKSLDSLLKIMENSFDVRLSDFLHRVYQLADIIMDNISGDALDNCMFLWRHCQKLKVSDARKLYRCCKVLFFMCRFFTLHEWNEKISAIELLVPGEGIFVERCMFEYRITKGHQIPVITKLMKHNIDALNLSIEDCSSLLFNDPYQNPLLHQIVAKSFYCFMSSNQCVESVENILYPESFYLDKCDMKVFLTEMLFLQTMILFFPIVVGNAIPYLKREFMELEEVQFIENVKKFVDYCQIILLDDFDLEIQSCDTFIKDFIMSDCMKNLENAFHSSNLFTDDEVLEILKESLLEFQSEIFGQRFSKLPDVIYDYWFKHFKYWHNLSVIDVINSQSFMVNGMPIKRERVEEVLQFEPSSFCWTCRLKGCPLFKCSKCQLAYYCSAQCQKDHWSTHKLLCQCVNFPPPTWNDFPLPWVSILDWNPIRSEIFFPVLEDLCRRTSKVVALNFEVHFMFYSDTVKLILTDLITSKANEQRDQFNILMQEQQDAEEYQKQIALQIFHIEADIRDVELRSMKAKKPKMLVSLTQQLANLRLALEQKKELLLAADEKLKQACSKCEAFQTSMQNNQWCRALKNLIVKNVEDVD